MNERSLFKILKFIGKFSFFFIVPPYARNCLLRKRQKIMNIQELYTLLKKYRERRCTIEESDKLNCWFEQFQEEADRIPGIPGGKT